MSCCDKLKVLKPTKMFRGIFLMLADIYTWEYWSDAFNVFTGRCTECLFIRKDSLLFGHVFGGFWFLPILGHCFCFWNYWRHFVQKFSQLYASHTCGGCFILSVISNIIKLWDWDTKWKWLINVRVVDLLQLILCTV